MHSRPRAFEGVRILDLAGPSGSYATKLFAELGADVLKVEPPGGDIGRWVGPFAGGRGIDQSIHWNYYNTSKRSVVLDIKSTEGPHHLLELARDADVLVDTDPWEFEAHGLGYEALKRVNPRLIYASLTPFGLTGPHARWKATDLIAAAMGGLLYLGGMPDGVPVWAAGEQSYLIGAAATATAVGMALVGRDRTGTGQRVDVSLQEAVAMATENAIGFWTCMRVLRRRLGERWFLGLPVLFRAADGWVIFQIGGRWDEILNWMESHGHDVTPFRRSDWSEAAYRTKHISEFESYIGRFFASLPKEQLFQEGQLRRLVIGPVRSIPEVVANKQLAARSYWTNVYLPQLGRSVPFPGAPYRLSATPWQLQGPAPTLGENSADWKAPPDCRRAHRVPARPGDQLPLGDIRVVDFGTNAVAPLVAKFLSAFGAEVIKIESRTRPGGQRSTATPKPLGKETINTGWMFMNFNTDKRSITVNMNVPSAHDFVRSVVLQADIVIDNFGVDPMPKWGMSAERLLELRPDLIIVKCSVAGRSGPERNFVGLGNSIMAMAGITALCGFDNQPPVATCTAHPDYSSNAHHALFAILAALYHRARTGEGQIIDLSQVESTIAFNGPAVLDYQINGVAGQPVRNRHSEMAPHGVFQCAGDDRWIAIACPDDETWTRLAELIGPSLAANSRFRTLIDRKAHEDEIENLVGAWCSRRDAQDLMIQLQRNGIPAGVAQTAQDLVEADEHLCARGFLRSIEHPEAGETLIMQPHFHLIETPGLTRIHSPLLGIDNEWIMGEVLGLDEKDIAALYVAGAVE